MHRKAELAVVVIQALLLLLLSSSNAQQDAHGISSCHRTSSAGDALTRLTFLRETAGGGGHRSLLYQSLWSEERLVRCSISNDPAVTESYLTLMCDGTDSPGDPVDRFDISALLAADGPCALDNSTGGPLEELTEPAAAGQRSAHWVDDDPRSVVRSRSKRSWLFPGTLWCGTGSQAVGYEQLGMFESADKCCREHDHCHSTIRAFRVNYGVFNPNFFTVSHCDCDQRFRQCLLGVNDPISSMVGYSFFNILGVPCFHVVRQRRCTEMYWWGMCKVAREAPYAVFQKPMPYNSTSIASKYDVTGAGHKSTRTKARDGMERPRTSQNRNPPKGEHRKPSVSSGRCAPRVPSRGDSVQWKKRKGKGCKRSSKTSATATSAPSTRTPASLLQAAATSTPLPKTAVTAAAYEFNTTASKGNKSGKNKGSRIKHKSQASSRATMEPRQKAASPQSSSPTMTQRGALQLQTTFPTATTITTIGKKRQRCGPRLPVRGDTFQSRRKPCADRKTTSHTLTAKVSPTEKTSVILWNSTTTTSSTATTTTAITTTTTITKPIKIKLRPGLLTQTTMLVAQRGNFPKQTNTYPLRDGTNQEMAAITDNLTLCGTLKHLDDCKHKIQPLEKKYNLQNMESKIVYHCDCTSRLAGQIENFRTPKILRSLLTDFVSENCFNLPNEKNCFHRKSSCAAGFSKAPRLFQAHKKTEERSTAGDHKLDRDVKRAIPVRFYKRCLKILHPRKRGRA